MTMPSRIITASSALMIAGVLLVAGGPVHAKKQYDDHHSYVAFHYL
jgi:hypothetical protein